jgi:hypothetical protein
VRSADERRVAERCDPAEREWRLREWSDVNVTATHLVYRYDGFSIIVMLRPSSMGLCGRGEAGDREVADAAHALATIGGILYDALGFVLRREQGGSQRATIAPADVARQSGATGARRARPAAVRLVAAPASAAVTASSAIASAVTAAVRAAVASIRRVAELGASAGSAVGGGATRLRAAPPHQTDCKGDDAEGQNERSDLHVRVTPLVALVLHHDAIAA